MRIAERGSIALTGNPSLGTLTHSLEQRMNTDEDILTRRALEALLPAGQVVELRAPDATPAATSPPPCTGISTTR